MTPATEGSYCRLTTIMAKAQHHSEKEFKFTYADFESLTGLSREAIWQHRTERGQAYRLNPDHLESLVLWIAANGTDELKEEIQEALRWRGKGVPKKRSSPKKKTTTKKKKSTA
jgi:hypothetical protein